MSKYISDHRDALSDVKAAGSAVTFRKVVPEHYDPDSDTTVPEAVVTVSGYAIKRRAKADDLRKYRRLELIESEAPYLFFVPNVYGTIPLLGSTVEWMGSLHTVRDCDPVAPDGTAIAAYVVVSR